MSSNIFEITQFVLIPYLNDILCQYDILHFPYFTWKLLGSYLHFLILETNPWHRKQFSPKVKYVSSKSPTCVSNLNSEGLLGNDTDNPFTQPWRVTSNQ